MADRRRGRAGAQAVPADRDRCRGPRRRRTWVPAMVPWRATEDGFVTPRRHRLVPRASPTGQPGVLVVEATGHSRCSVGPAPADRSRSLRRRAWRSSPTRCTRRRAARRCCSSSSSTFSRSAAGRSATSSSRGSSRSSRHHRSALRGVGDELRTTLTDDELRARLAALADDELARRARRARARGSTMRAIASASPTCTCRTSRELPRVLPRLVRATPPSARWRPASTASSCTSRTRTRWRRSSRALNTRDDGYGGPREQRVRLPREVIAAVRARVAAARRRRLPLPRR